MLLKLFGTDAKCAAKCAGRDAQFLWRGDPLFMLLGLRLRSFHDKNRHRRHR